MEDILNESLSGFRYCCVHIQQSCGHFLAITSPNLDLNKESPPQLWKDTDQWSQSWELDQVANEFLVNSKIL